MVAFSNHHSGPLTYDVLGDEDDIPFLRAMFGDQAVDFQIWKHGIQQKPGKELAGPCRDGGIHDALHFNGGHPVGHRICGKCSQAVCCASGQCVPAEEGEPWRL